MLDVSNFMERLAKQTSSPNARVFNRQTRKIEKLSLNHPSNLGRYQVLPFNSEVINYPFISGMVRQINIPRKTTDQSGQENVYNAWIHIPTPGFYQMLDETGRAVSSLSAEDEKLLESTSTLWEELYKELGAKENWAKYKDLIRRRNYTIFAGYCLNFWKYGSDTRTPDRQNFSALFMITTKAFATAVQSNINDKTIMEGGDQSWVEKIYNNQLKNRDGFLLFSINKDKDRAGFISSASHEFGRAQMLSSIEIPEDDFNAGMNDPVSLFLGWQASNQDNDKPYGYRRLFNAKLIKEAADYMGSLLSAIRAVKASGGSDFDEAIQKINESVAGGPVTDGNATTAAPTQQEDPTTPGAAQIDPLMGNSFASSGNASTNTFSGFSTPDFSKAAPGFDPSNTPF